MGKHHKNEVVSIEQTAAIHIDPEDLGYESIQEPQDTLRTLGRYALMRDGFKPLGEVESPYQSIREKLEQTIIDQPAAIEAIIDALDASGARMPSDHRPIANFAFLGPTGVGKSETAKVLSQFLGLKYGKKPNLIKIECAALSQSHDVTAQLTGSPAGYVGYGDKPLLHPTRVEKPGTVILFDEIEKASPQLFRTMLHILEDGELQMAKSNEKSHFRDTIIIMTSNLGARDMAAKIATSNTKQKFGFGNTVETPVETPHADLDTIALQGFNRFFAQIPEFDGRIDQKIVFHALSEESLSRILDTKLDQYNIELDKEYGAKIELTNAAHKHLVDIAMREPHLGARPLVRALKNNVYQHLGRYISTGDIRIGTRIAVAHSSEFDDQDTENKLLFYAKQKALLELPPSPSSMPKHRQKHDVAEDIPA